MESSYRKRLSWSIEESLNGILTVLICTFSSNAEADCQRIKYADCIGLNIIESESHVRCVCQCLVK